MPSSLKVLLVDDSRTSLASLAKMISTCPDFTVIGMLTDPKRVVDAVLSKGPDVILMDLDMGDMDGAEVTAEVMRTRPTPILIVTSLSRSSGSGHFRALEAGAVDILGKDALSGGTDDPAIQRLLHRKIKIVSGVAVVRRKGILGLRRGAEPAPVTESPQGEAAGGLGGPTSPAKGPPSRTIPPAPGARRRPACRIVGVGASTGGPAALQTLLGSIGPGLAVPVVVVQHMDREFMEGFVSWLALSTGRRVVLASQGQILEPGTVYIAPADWHLTVTARMVVLLEQSEPLHDSRPSVDRLFLSLAVSFGASAIGVLLTGMGRDGAAGLRRLLEAGALTFAQSEASCTVFGMPGEAVKIGGAGMVLPVDAIGDSIAGHLRVHREEP
ncbi:MAG: chemotaxis-specific protein-glutamate methyltransferase CheB [Candidatus Riflebacteria bacterium]|nr:chemotaxis-specific protein-glutamate methyltransferase CheB [Candidatus Riflebacteria bacterium]